MARTRAQKHADLEAKSGDGADGGHGAGIVPAISKAQAVRNALGEGLDDLGEIAHFVKSSYAIDIPKQMISAYKSQAKSKMVKTKAVRGRRPKGAEGGYVQAERSRRSDEGGLLGALEALKPMVASMGAEKVKRLVDLLG